MKPKIIDRPERLHVGMSASFRPGSDNQTIIPPLWQEFTRRRSSLPDATKGFVGLCTGVQPDGTAVYTAAVEVPAIVTVPDGMVTLRTPAGKCAEFRHHGPISGLGRTLGSIYGTWLPGSGFTRSARAYDIEVYASDQVQSADFQLLYLVPIEPK